MGRITGCCLTSRTPSSPLLSAGLLFWTLEAPDWLFLQCKANLPSRSTSVPLAGDVPDPAKPSPFVFHDPNSHLSTAVLSNTVVTRHV